MFKVYRIDNQHMQDNRYRVDRFEHWTCKLDKKFSSEAEAKEYVLLKNRQNSDMVIMGFHIKDELDKSKFYHDFCFDDKYQSVRRYFLGKPNTSIIEKQLTDRGIQFQKE
jgi:hypothetical protein